MSVRSSHKQPWSKLRKNQLIWPNSKSNQMLHVRFFNSTAKRGWNEKSTCLHPELCSPSSPLYIRHQGFNLLPPRQRLAAGTPAGLASASLQGHRRRRLAEGAPSAVPPRGRLRRARTWRRHARGVVLRVQRWRALLQRAPAGAGPRRRAPPGADVLRAPGGLARPAAVRRRHDRSGRARERSARVVVRQATAAAARRQEQEGGARHAGARRVLRRERHWLVLRDAQRADARAGRGVADEPGGEEGRREARRRGRAVAAEARAEHHSRVISELSMHHSSFTFVCFSLSWKPFCKLQA